MSRETKDRISDLIKDVVKASGTPPKSRSINVKAVVADLISFGYESGFDSEHLDELLKVLTTPGHLDQPSIAALIRNLYPVGRVSKSNVLRVLGCLGQGALKVSLAVQGSLVKWLILVHHVLEAPLIYSQAYAVVFNLLDTAALRPHISHLLALITRRQHVQPFRIQTLLGFSRQTGNDPNLVGLLRIFKDYYPEIVVGDATRGKGAAFKHPDPSWRTRLDELQLANAETRLHDPSGFEAGLGRHKPFNAGRDNRTLPVPVRTTHAAMDSLTVEEIEDAISLVEHIDKVELPNQLVAVLSDSVLQKVIMLRPTNQAHQRVVFWLESALQEAMDGQVNTSGFWDMLAVMHDYVSRIQTIPPIFLNFLAQFIKVWDGSGRMDMICDIMSYVPLHSFDQLFAHLLQPLEAVMTGMEARGSIALLKLYSRILRHWSITLKSLDDSDIPDHAQNSISSLIRQSSEHATRCMQFAPTVSTQSQILDLHEQSVQLVIDNSIRQRIRIELPPSTVIYNCFLSNSLATISRLCQLLADYKEGFEMAMNPQRYDGQEISPITYEKAYVGLYNGYIMDICNCLWRSRAFSDGDASSHGCMIPRSTVSRLAAYIQALDGDFSMASLLSLSYSPILCRQSILSLRQVEDAQMEQARFKTRHAGPVTRSSLERLAVSSGVDLTWQNYRIKVLQYLAEQGFPGIAELLKKTMVVLKKSMEDASNRRIVSS